MTCPKCKTENQRGSFCGECGERLRERCAECGKMEPVGRPVCETALEEASGKLSSYLAETTRRIGYSESLAMDFFLLGFPFVLLAVLSLYLSQFVSELGALALFSCYGCIGFILTRIAERRSKEKERMLKNERRIAWTRAKMEFLQKFPHYADILKKAEGGER